MQPIINKIVAEGDKCHSAIKMTLGMAQKGQTFAEEIVVFCGALADKPDFHERQKELLSNLIKTAEIAHRRSVKANEKLESVRDELSKV